MLGICRQYISDKHMAEEHMLNGFLKVFTKLDSFKFKGSLENNDIDFWKSHYLKTIY